MIKKRYSSTNPKILSLTSRVDSMQKYWNNTSTDIFQFYSEGIQRIDPLKLYTYLFKEIPNHISFTEVKATEMYEIIKTKFQDRILREIKLEKYHPKKQKLVNYSICYFETGEMIDNCGDEIVYGFNKEILLSVSELKELSNDYVVKSSINYINLLTDSGGYPSFNSFKIKTITDFNLENYNDDFEEFDKKLKEDLFSQKNGLVLLYGTPGSGKTSYLRHLISTINQQILFLPSGMAYQLSNPGFISLLENKEGSILVIEDAEEALLAREISGNNSAVSSLLNLTDGLLADVLNLRIICTFNTDLKYIDKALLRPGRLMGLYEFKELTIERAQLISDKLGQNRKISNPTVLAELYNNPINKNDIPFSRKLVGFTK